MFGTINAVPAYLALLFSLFFLTFYAIRYYASIGVVLLTSHGNNNNNKNGLRNALNNTHNRAFNNSFNLRRFPLVSIHLPFYNEKNVALRIIDMCLSLDYPNFEVIVVDDSTDETSMLIEGFRGSPRLLEIANTKGYATTRELNERLKVFHRESRKGFKGGALKEALRHTDPKAEFIMVFDADFIPPRDIIQRFLVCFNNRNNNYSIWNSNHVPNGNENVVEAVDAWRKRMEIAGVQGYQLHTLNISENWITRGVRAEYSGNYVVERTFQELVGTMKMIAGSVFMMRADVLNRLDWSESLTEDWELTLRLYLEGYKVVYTPLIQAPGEIPSTFERLVKQRQRWAESHTYNVKKFFWKILLSPKLNAREKLEFMYYAPYYLQSIFLLVGTFCWLFAEAACANVIIMVPFAGWILLLANFLSLPMMSLTGLYLEGRAGKDWKGIFSQILLTHLLAPFQAYSAIKGLVEKREGKWIRTYKTGKITEAITMFKLRQTVRSVLSKKRTHRGFPRYSLL